MKMDKKLFMSATAVTVAVVAGYVVYRHLRHEEPTLGGALESYPEPDPVHDRLGGSSQPS